MKSSSFRKRTSLRGQAAVLALLCLSTLLIVLALATNMGSLVSERIRIQNSADLAAYSGAYEQSSRLNDIAALNTAILSVATYCRARLTEPGPGFNGGMSSAYKVWSSCAPEERYDGPPPRLPEPPTLHATSPDHDLSLPPNSDSGSLFMTGTPHRYGALASCRMNQDPRAEDLINWCARTIDYYAQMIYDLNDYGAAYYGDPSTAGVGSLPSKGPIMEAVRNTARANYPGLEDSDIELLDAPDYSPVHRSRFDQPGVGNSDVSSYRREGGDAMLPLRRHAMTFNYAYCCCLETPGGWGIGCGPGGGLSSTLGNGIMRGPVIQGERELQATFYRVPDGVLYLPLRITGNPGNHPHPVPLLDIGSDGDHPGYFSENGGWNDLQATAVAKPYEGLVGPSVFHLDTLYAVNSTNAIGLATADAQDEMISDGVVPYPTSRARLVGFSEPIMDRSKRILRDLLMDHDAATGDGATDAPLYQYTAH